MNTAEMWISAHEDGCIYRCPDFDVLYSRSTGLINDDDYNDEVYLEDFEGYTIDKLMSFEWVKTEKFMTIKEAEKKYGIKIIRSYED